MYITLSCILLLLCHAPTVFLHPNTILNQELEGKQTRKQRVTYGGGEGREGAYKKVKNEHNQFIRSIYY